MADNPMGEPFVVAAFTKLGSVLPGFAGAVLSLAFVEALTARGRVVAVVVGLCAAMWVAPGLADAVDLAWPGVMPATVRSAIQFLVGLCAMGCLPPLLAWLKKVAGDPLSLLKVRFGPANGS